MIILMVLATLLAQSPRPKAPGEDWVSLYNGKDLTGWTPIGAESWTVEGDGLLHGKGLTKAYGYLQTNKDYKDFQMSLRFKCVGDGNSGVFFNFDLTGSAISKAGASGARANPAINRPAVAFGTSATITYHPSGRPQSQPRVQRLPPGRASG